MSSELAIPTPSAIRLADINDLVQRAIEGTHDDRVAVGQQLTQASHLATWHINFGLGDLANAEAPAGEGERNPERTELLRQYAEEIDKAPNTLEYYAITARAWPDSCAGAELTKTVPWITSSDDPEARTRTYAIPYRRPEVGFEVHKLLAPIAEADRAAAMDAVIERGGGKQAAMEYLAEQADARKQAADAATARPQYASQRHGASGATEEAYDSEAHDRWIKVEREKDVAALEAQANVEPVTEVRQPQPIGYSAAPTANDILHDLADLAAEIEELDHLTIRDANDFHRLLTRIGKAVDERS